MWPQICAEVVVLSSKYPDFGGPTDFFEKILKKDPAGVRLYSVLYAPPSRIHSDIPPGPPNAKRMALKTPVAALGTSSSTVRRNASPTAYSHSSLTSFTTFKLITR